MDSGLRYSTRMKAAIRFASFVLLATALPCFGGGLTQKKATLIDGNLGDT
jgi:hypothetical protein